MTVDTIKMDCGLVFDLDTVSEFTAEGMQVKVSEYRAVKGLKTFTLQLRIDEEGTIYSYSLFMDLAGIPETEFLCRYTYTTTKKVYLVESTTKKRVTCTKIWDRLDELIILELSLEELEDLKDVKTVEDVTVVDTDDLVLDCGLVFVLDDVSSAYRADGDMKHLHYYSADKDDKHFELLVVKDIQMTPYKYTLTLNGEVMIKLEKYYDETVYFYNASSDDWVLDVNVLSVLNDLVDSELNKIELIETRDPIKLGDVELIHDSDYSFFLGKDESSNYDCHYYCAQIGDNRFTLVVRENKDRVAIGYSLYFETATTYEHLVDLKTSLFNSDLFIDKKSSPKLGHKVVNREKVLEYLTDVISLEYEMIQVS